MQRKDTPRHDAFGSWGQPNTMNDAPPSPVDMIAAPKKKQRDRTWEMHNPACSYVVPRRLWTTAQQVRDNILSIVQHDEQGELREDRTTVNAVASALMDWALNRVEREPSLLKFSPNPQSRGHMTVTCKEADGWEETPIQLPTPKQRERQSKEVHVLSYRWTNSNIDQRLRDLAGVDPNANHKKKSPFTYTVPIGEVVVRLLQLAIEDYKSRRMRLKVQQIAISQTAAGWEALRSK